MYINPELQVLNFEKFYQLFSLVGCDFGVTSKNSWPNSSQQDFLLCFLLKVLYLVLTFRCAIQFYYVDLYASTLLS